MTITAFLKPTSINVSPLLLVTLLLFCESCGSGNNKAMPRDEKTGDCIIKTLDHPHANGINIDVHYPCTWSEVHEHDDHPMMIKQVGSMTENENSNIALTVMISRLADTLNPEKLDRLRREVYIEKRTAMAQGAMFADTLEINGVKAGWIVTSETGSKSGWVAYSLNVQLFYKYNLIQLIYMINAPTENEAISFFEEKKEFFLELAKKTKFF